MTTKPPEPSNTSQPLPPGCPGHPYPYEEDEINLLDLFIVFLKYKWFILTVVILSGILAVVISLSMTNIYRSSATITPQKSEKPSIIPSFPGFGGISGFLGLGGNTNLSNLEVVLQSRELSQRVIKKFDLLPVLFEKSWDSDKKKWRNDPHPTEQDGIKLLRDTMLSVSTDNKKNILYVQFDHKDPIFAQEMVNRYLTELSEVMREEVLEGAEEKAEFLGEELNRTLDALMKEKISELLANELEKMTFARVQKYYNFEVIDPPIVPDLNKKLKPKRSLICILTVIVAFFLATFLAFFIEFIRNAKDNAEPEQLENLQKYLGKIRISRK